MPWDIVNIRVLGLEMVYAGLVFDGSEEEIMKFLDDNGYIYKVF